MDITTAARKHAIKNAHDYGKADAKAVIGKVLAEAPDAKKDFAATMKTVKAAVDEANSLDKQGLEAALAGFDFEKPKKEEPAGIVLLNAEKGKVITRFPPEPNGYPHIGHAKAALLNYDAAKAYGGKMVIRWDDTNPQAERAEFVEAIREGLSWLGIKAHAETFVSDDMPTLYKLGKQLIEQGDAYACICPQQKIRDLRAAMKGCECRENQTETNLDMWEGMHNGRFRHDQAIIRLKADMASLNTAMRDPVLFRIIEEPHYRQKDKYRVWPTYDFEVSIEDSITGVTHAMRSKEYELRDELYFYILDKLKMRRPQLIEFSRLSIKGLPISKRLLKKLIEEGKVSGWDDPRLPTLAGLRKRGITPQAISNFVRSFGLSKVESEPPIDRLLIENRRLLDPVADHYFFVANPVRVHVAGAVAREIALPKHPARENAGTRKMSVRDQFYIQKSDADLLEEGAVFRLKDLMAVRVREKGMNYVEAELAGDNEPAKHKVQWAPNSGQALSASLVVPTELLDANEEYRPESLRVIEGYCEPECAKLKEGDFVQFERVGFARLDDAATRRFVLCTEPRL